MQTNYLYVYLSIFPSMQRCFVQCNYNYGTCLWKFKCCQHNWKLNVATLITFQNVCIAMWYRRVTLEKTETARIYLYYFNWCNGI